MGASMTEKNSRRARDDRIRALLKTIEGLFPAPQPIDPVRNELEMIAEFDRANQELLSQIDRLNAGLPPQLVQKQPRQKRI
jgi:hypothetical protein